MIPTICFSIMFSELCLADKPPNPGRVCTTNSRLWLGSHLDSVWCTHPSHLSVPFATLPRSAPFLAGITKLLPRFGLQVCLCVAGVCLWQARGSQTYIIECLKKAGRQRQQQQQRQEQEVLLTSWPCVWLCFGLHFQAGWPAPAVVVVVHCFGPKQGMLQLCSLHTFQQFMFGMWIPLPTP